MIKTVMKVIEESTCQKRITFCEILGKSGVVLSRESNRCAPDKGICHRIGVIQNKENYDKDSNCNWTHAEIMAIKNLPDGSEPHAAIVYGHNFFCDNCENELKKVGVVEFTVVPNFPPPIG